MEFRRSLFFVHEMRVILCATRYLRPYLHCLIPDFNFAFNFAVCVCLRACAKWSQPDDPRWCPRAAVHASCTPHQTQCPPPTSSVGLIYSSKLYYEVRLPQFWSDPRYGTDEHVCIHAHNDDDDNNGYNVCNIYPALTHERLNKHARARVHMQGVFIIRQTCWDAQYYIKHVSHPYMHILKWTVDPLRTGSAKTKAEAHKHQGWSRCEETLHRHAHDI